LEAISPKVKWSGHEVNHSPPFRAKDKNEWSYTFYPPVCRHSIDWESLPLHNNIYHIFTWSKKNGILFT